MERGELGLINQEPAHILVENTTPCRAPVYRYPEKAKETIKEILEDLEQRDIIEKSTAAWLSPIVLVNKPSGEKRLCLDYRKVNTHLATHILPIPKLEELVENVAGHQYYATLDLKDAYYQVLLDEESRDLTTFTEGVNLYRFRRLPFGLSCSASIFVRQLNNAIAPLLKQTWIAKRNYEIRVAREAKNNPKKFFNIYRTKTRERIGPLKTEAGEIIESGEEMSKLLNDYLLSVFTRENQDTIPVGEEVFKGEENEKLLIL